MNSEHNIPSADSKQDIPYKDSEDDITSGGESEGLRLSECVFRGLMT